MAAAIRRGAERLLVVSSSPSVMGEASERMNGFDILVRYIDVSTGGVLESEIDWAPRLAESRRLAEYTECRIQADASREICPPNECDPKMLCSGDWERVCKAQEPAAGENAGTGALESTQNAEDLLAPIWQSTSIYRDEHRVPGLPGYVFRRADQRKLFLAGAEEARQRCLEIANVLGLPVDTSSWQKKLFSWCTPKLRALKPLCGDESSDEQLRSCSEPRPPLSAPQVKCSKRDTP